MGGGGPLLGGSACITPTHTPKHACAHGNREAGRHANTWPHNTVQWNLSKVDTIGTHSAVLYRKVPLLRAYFVQSSVLFGQHSLCTLQSSNIQTNNLNTVTYYTVHLKQQEATVNVRKVAANAHMRKQTTVASARRLSTRMPEDIELPSRRNYDHPRQH